MTELVLMALCVLAMGVVAGWTAALMLGCACAFVYWLAFTVTLR